MELLTAIVIGLMFAIGIFQILRRNVIRSVIGLFIMSNAVNLFLLTAGAYSGEAAAYTTASSQTSDALPQALILTAIVISMAGFALVLAFVYVLSLRYRTSDSDQIRRLRH